MTASSASDNPLCRLNDFGQSVWLDFLSRGLMTRGELASLIEADSVSGVTSNPAIFEKAIAGSADYDGAIRTLAAAGNTTTKIYERLTVEDVGRAADLFRGGHAATRGRDGFVSLEVSPHLADDAQGTLVEARRLWAALDRQNVLIKVPGTRAGVSAIRALIAEGISVNVTLLFSVARYQEVAEAYLAGLESRVANGLPIAGIASVASFFLSRIDTLLDPMLAKAPGGQPLVGEVAIASAKLAYAHYRELTATARWHALAAKGASPQRLLWASTSTKNPAYSPVKYVEPLVGPETINTMPMETIVAYREQGAPADRIGMGLEQARRAIAALPGVGIDLAKATDQLERDGVQKFIQPFDALLESIERKRSAIG